MGVKEFDFWNSFQGNQFIDEKSKFPPCIELEKSIFYDEMKANYDLVFISSM